MRINAMPGTELTWAGAPVAAAVVRQLERLGATRGAEQTSHDPVPLEQCWNQSFCSPDRETWDIGCPGCRDPLGQLTAMPAAIALVWRDINWPEGLTMNAPTGEPVAIELVGSSEGPDAIVDGNRRLLVMFANTSKTFDMFYLDALDGSPDPAVYTSDSDGLDLQLCDYKLSDFLAGLTPSPADERGSALSS